MNVVVLFTFGVLAILSKASNVDLVEDLSSDKNTVIRFNGGDSYPWDHFVFAQLWPPAYCSHFEKCVVPCAVREWTIHGLWPSYKGTHSPAYCDNSSRFDEAQVAALLSEMKFNWPNINATSAKDDFWSYEWSKHGTCAMSNQELSTQYLYFKQALHLHALYNVTRSLQKSNIVPSSNPYMVSSVRAVLDGAFGKASYLISCQCAENSTEQFLQQVEICLSKDSYKPITCQKSRRPMKSLDTSVSNRKYEPCDNCAQYKTLTLLEYT